MKNHSKFVYTLLYSVQKRNIWCIEYVFVVFLRFIWKSFVQLGGLADWRIEMMQLNVHIVYLRFPATPKMKWGTHVGLLSVAHSCRGE